MEFKNLLVFYFSKFVLLLFEFIVCYFLINIEMILNKIISILYVDTQGIQIEKQLIITYVCNISYILSMIVTCYNK